MVRGLLHCFGVLSYESKECPICSLYEESSNHLFLHCAWSRMLWSLCIGWWTVSCCCNCNLKEWFRGWKGLCPNPKFGRVWAILFNAIAWSIWEVRNQAVFNGIEANLAYYLELVRFMVAWWFKNHGKGSSDPITIIVENLQNCCVDEKVLRIKRTVAWTPTIHEDLIFTMDGSVQRELGRTGIGGVLCNSKGEVLCFFSAYVGNLDATTSELLAILKACNLYKSKSFLNGRITLIASDSKEVVSWVNNDDFGNINLVDIIYDIRSMLRLMKNISIHHISRATNSKVDDLAKRGSSFSSVRDFIK